MTLLSSRGMHVLVLIALVFVVACQPQSPQVPIPIAIVPTVALDAPTLIPSPTVIATSTPTPAPTRIAQTIPTPPPVEESGFDVLMKPLAAEAFKRRAERAKSDPEFAKSVDLGLNEDRVNFLLYGYGETHEPPVTEKATIGSYTIISYDLKSHKADVVSFTHDIRAPEVERALWKPGEKFYALRMDHAYHVGGFKLQRQMIRNATGLAVDYQISFRDAAIASAVDNVFEGVEVTVPFEFKVHPFYLDGKKYPQGAFPQGAQKMDGKRVIQFIKTVPITEGYYGKTLEHNTRKHLVFSALLESLKRKYVEPKFWLNISGFVTKELMAGTVTYDFDPIPLALNNISAATATLNKLSSTREIPMPAIRRSIYVVDVAHGDGGVRWVEGDALENPISKKDLADGIYPHLAYEVPPGANPYGDLVTEYWGPVRRLVRGALLVSMLPANAQPE